MKKRRVATTVIMTAIAISLMGCNQEEPIETSSEALINVDRNDGIYGSSSDEEASSEESTSSVDIPTKPDNRPPIQELGVADGDNYAFDLPPTYNTTFKPNIDDGTEITLEIVPTLNYPTCTLKDNGRVTFDKLYEYWKKSDQPPALVTFDKDTKYCDIVNAVPVDYGLSKVTDREPLTLKIGENEHHETVFEYIMLAHRFNAARPDSSPTVYLELVDGTGKIVDDPADLNYDSDVIRVKAIMTRSIIGNGTVDQQVPLIYNFSVRTLTEKGEREYMFQTGNEWTTTVAKLTDLFEGKNDVKFQFLSDQNNVEQYFFLKTSNYTIVLYTVGAGALNDVILIRN